MITFMEDEGGNHSVLVKGVPCVFTINDLFNGHWEDTKKGMLDNINDIYSDLIDEAAQQLYASK